MDRQTEHVPKRLCERRFARADQARDRDVDVLEARGDGDARAVVEQREEEVDLDAPEDGLREVHGDDDVAQVRAREDLDGAIFVSI